MRGRFVALVLGVMLAPSTHATAHDGPEVRFGDAALSSRGVEIRITWMGDLGSDLSSTKGAYALLDGALEWHDGQLDRDLRARGSVALHLPDEDDPAQVSCSSQDCPEARYEQGVNADGAAAVREMISAPRWDHVVGSADAARLSVTGDDLRSEPQLAPVLDAFERVRDAYDRFVARPADRLLREAWMLALDRLPPRERALALQHASVGSLGGLSDPTDALVQVHGISASATAIGSGSAGTDASLLAQASATAGRIVLFGGPRVETSAADALAIVRRPGEGVARAVLGRPTAHLNAIVVHPAGTGLVPYLQAVGDRLVASAPEAQPEVEALIRTAMMLDELARALLGYSWAGAEAVEHASPHGWWAVARADAGTIVLEPGVLPPSAIGDDPANWAGRVEPIGLRIEIDLPRATAQASIGAIH